MFIIYNFKTNITVFPERFESERQAKDFLSDYYLGLIDALNVATNDDVTKKIETDIRNIEYLQIREVL